MSVINDIKKAITFKRTNKWPEKHVESYDGFDYKSVLPCDRSLLYGKSEAHQIPEFPADINKLALITCHFNPCGYKSPVNNFWKFVDGLGDYTEHLYVAELSFNDNFSINLPNTFRFRGRREDQLVWQKERLLNALIDKVPYSYDAIAWLDSDILFLNNNWYKATIDVLRCYKICQMYEYSHWLDEFGRVALSRPSCGHEYHNNWGHHSKCWQLSHAHPGYCWAARSDLLRKVRLYDFNITGGGDAVMLIGFFNSKIWWKFNNKWLSNISKWSLNSYENTMASVGYVPIDIMHLYHGSRENRQYVSRWQLLVNNNYNPDDLYIDNNGLLTWHDESALSRAVEEYFITRQDDN